MKASISPPRVARTCGLFGCAAGKTSSTRIDATAYQPTARHHTSGECLVAAFVQLAPGAEATEQELIEHCVGNIATFKVPRYVRFLEDWPMSGTKLFIPIPAFRFMSR